MGGRLNSELRKIMASPEDAGKLTEVGGNVKTSTTEEFGAWLNKAIADWGAVVQAENIHLD